MLVLVAPTSVLSLAPVSVEAAGYLKIGDIKGESSDEAHKDWINLQSFSWGVTSLVRGGAMLKELIVTKELDKSSPLLFLATATGETIPKVILRMTRPNADGTDEIYYEMTLENVRIVRHTTDSKLVRTERPEEHVSLIFPKVEISYTPIDKSGKVTVKWELDEKL